MDSHHSIHCVAQPSTNAIATVTANAFATAIISLYATATFVEMSQYFWLDGRKDLPTTAMIRSQLNFNQTNNFQVILNTKLK